MSIDIPHHWAPRKYQLPLWDYMAGGGKRASVVWHRRAGKDLFAMNWCVRAMVTAMEPGLYWHLLPTYTQGRKIVWDGFTNDGRKYLSHFPKQILAKDPNKQNMMVEIIDTRNGNKGTGSMYQVVGTDDIDRLVGTNPRGCIFSEYSLQDPRAWRYISPILAANGGWAMFIFTYRGKNHAYQQHMRVKDHPDWFTQVLTVDDTTYINKVGDEVPVVSQAIIDAERASGMPEELIQQEYYCVPDAGMVGSYYGDMMHRVDTDKRINNDVCYDPALPVHTAWDLGMDDSTAIWFFQLKGDFVHLIDYVEKSGWGLPQWAEHLNSLGYAYGVHIAPHDMSVREMGTGVTRYEVAKTLGYKFEVLPRLALQEGIDAVRRLLPRTRFNRKGTAEGVDALVGYQRKWDEKKQIFQQKPQHDWASHGADAFRYLALGLKKVERKMHPRRQYDILKTPMAITDYDKFS